jgi:hypothetical protein
MVGAQLDGFDTMVHLPDENDFIVLEAMSICPHLTMTKAILFT